MWTLPGFVEGFKNFARDEQRHVAAGARLLRGISGADTRYIEAISRTLTEVMPAADGPPRPKWVEPGQEDGSPYGVWVTESRRSPYRRSGAALM